MNIATQVLPVALGIMMLGLGLTLTFSDFARIARRPFPVALALVLQLLVLPVVCLGLVEAFDLQPIYAVGMLLLAAAPGGPGANLLSHLFGGDVALNVSLTAVNTLLSVVTLPAIYNLAAHHFTPDRPDLGLQVDRMLVVCVEILAPVLVGLLLRRRWPRLAEAVERPLKIAVVAFLVVLVVGAIAQNVDRLTDDGGPLVGIAVTFSVLSLSIGYLGPRVFRLGHAQAVACSFEIGYHNAVLAIVVAETVIGSESLALPPAIYTLVTQPLIIAFGLLVRRLAVPTTPQEQLA